MYNNNTPQPYRAAADRGTQRNKGNMTAATVSPSVTTPRPIQVNLIRSLEKEGWQKPNNYWTKFITGIDPQAQGGYQIQGEFVKKENTVADRIPGLYFVKNRDNNNLTFFELLPSGDITIILNHEPVNWQMIREFYEAWSANRSPMMSRKTAILQSISTRRAQIEKLQAEIRDLQAEMELLEMPDGEEPEF